MRTKRFWDFLYRFVFPIFTVLLFFAAALPISRIFAYIASDSHRITESSSFWIQSAILALLCYSLCRTFLIYNAFDRKQYKMLQGKSVIERILFVLGHPKYWTEVFFFGCALSIYPEKGPFFYLFDFLERPDVTITFAWSELLVFSTVFPVFLIVLLLSHLSAQKHIIGDENIYLNLLEGIEKKRKEQKLVLKLAQTVAIYFLGILVITFVLPVFTLFFAVNGPLAVITVILVITTVIRLYRLIRAFLIRQKFQRKFLRFCEERNLNVKFHNNIMQSVFFPSKTVDFTVLTGENKYDCKLIPSLAKYSPVFANRECLVRTKTIRITKDLILFHRVTFQNYRFESSNKKIIILNPAPHRFYLESSGRKKPADVGERIEDYVFFNGSGFLNALDRGSLDLYYKK